MAINRQISLVHGFGLLTKGTVSIAFYDVAPGQETLYEKLSVYNSKTGKNAAIGKMDFDSECDSAAFVLNAVARQRELWHLSASHHLANPTESRLACVHGFLWPVR